MLRHANMCLTSDFKLRYTLAFTFGNLLQDDLEDFVADWNSHYLRKSRNPGSPYGRPDDIYSMPALYG